MISNRILVLAIAALAGCTEDVPTVHATTFAMTQVVLSAPDDGIASALGHYRWALADAPADATDSSPSETAATITVVPSTRGIYVYDRWFVGPAAEQLTHHFLVTVAGVRPTAVVAGHSPIAVGSATSVDGSSSASQEHLSLTFQWRLAWRPESSTSTISDGQDTVLTLVPDVAGEYAVELRVFDGELWSQPATAMLVAR